MSEVRTAGTLCPIRRRNLCVMETCMATQTTAPPAAEQAASAQLQRKDNWWVAPLQFFLLFSIFGTWATFRAFQNGFYSTADIPALGSNYLSPFYSPTIKTGLHLFGFGLSPALVILPFPLAFRLSCYYYRKMIYRSYTADPLACAVTEPRPLEQRRFKRYTGERAFPLIAQNFHRYAFYAAVAFIVFLWKDTIDAFFFTDGGQKHFGMGLGSLIFLVNICLLTAYTFSCHSWRHLIG